MFGTDVLTLMTCTSPFALKHEQGHHLKSFSSK